MENMEQTKKPPLIRSNTGSLKSPKRHGNNTLYASHSLSLPFHYHYHRRNHEEARSSSPLRTKPATAPPWKESPIEIPRREPVSSSLPASRKVSLQNDMRLARRSSAPTKPQQRKSPIEQDDISTTILSLQAAGQHQMHHLDATYSAVLQKLHDLSAISSRLHDLEELAKSTMREFEAADADCRSDFAAQIHGIERFRDELDPIKVLRDRLMVQKRRVKDYHERLDRVQEKIDRHKEMEIIWRQRASRRLRLLWGFISVFVIFWLLVTGDTDPTEMSLQQQGGETIQGSRDISEIVAIVPLLSDEALSEL